MEWFHTIVFFFEVHILAIMSVNVVNKSTGTTIKIVVTQGEVCNLELLDITDIYRIGDYTTTISLIKTTGI